MGPLLRQFHVRTWTRRTARVLLPVALVVAGWHFWDNVEARRLDSLMRRIRAVAFSRPGPVLLPPGTGRGTAHYLAAALLVDTGSAWRLEWRYGHITRAAREALAGGTPFPAWMQREMAEALVANARTLDLMRAGSREDVVEESVGYPSLPANAALLPGSARLEEAAQAEAMRTLERLIARDWAGAGWSLVVRIRFLRAYRDVGGSAAYPISNDVRSIAADLALLLQRSDVPDAVLDEVVRALDRAHRYSRVDRVIAAGALIPYRYVEEMWQGRSLKYGVAGTLMRPLFRHATVAELRTVHDALDAIGLSWPQRLRVLESLEDQEPAVPRWLLPEAAVRDTSSLIYDRVSQVANGMVQTRTAHLAILADRHRRVTGALPDRIQEVAPDVDTDDVYGGGALRYVREADGFAIYSIGPDRVDDNGALAPPPQRDRLGRQRQSADIGIRVVYRRAASTSPSNNGRNSPVR